MKYYTNWNYTLLVITFFFLSLHSVAHMMDMKLPDGLSKFTWVIWQIEMVRYLAKNQATQKAYVQGILTKNLDLLSFPLD